MIERKSIIALLLTLILALAPCAALAEEDSGFITGPNPGDFVANSDPETGSELNLNIGSFCAIGDTLYMISMDLSELYIHRLGAEAPEIKPINVELQGDEDRAAQLLQNGDSLMLLVMEVLDGQLAGRLCRVDYEGEEASAEPVADIDMSALTDQMDYPMPPDSFVSLEHCAVGVYYDAGYARRLCVLDYADNTMRDLPLDVNADSLASCGGDSVMVLQSQWQGDKPEVTLLKVDAMTGEANLAAQETRDQGMIYGLCQDPASGEWYAVQGGEIVRFDLDTLQALEPVTDMPMEMEYGRAPVMLDGSCIAFAGFNGYLVRSLKPDTTDRRRLRIYDTSWSSAVNQARTRMTKQHPDVTVIVSHEFNTPLVDAMMNRDDSMDLFVSVAADPSFTAARSRGYMLDFAESPALSALEARLPENLLNDLSVDGHLAALPVSYYLQVMSYRAEPLEALGYAPEDFPTNWLDFMDFLKGLEDRLPEDGSVRVTDPWLSAEDIRQQLLSQVFVTYQMTLSYAPDQARTEDMIEVLNRLDAIDFHRLGLYSRDEIDDESFSVDYEPDSLLLQWEISMQLGGITKSGYIPVSMSLMPGGPAYVPLDMTACFINPYTQNMDIALEFVEDLAETMDEELSYILFSDLTAPVENKYQEEQVAGLEETLEGLRIDLESAEEIDRQMLEEQVAEYEGFLEEARNDRWEISEEDIAWRDAHREQFRLLPDNWLYSEDSGDAWQLVEQFAAGQLSADRLMGEIDRKLRMMILENGY